jgi:hypothetical protein
MIGFGPPVGGGGSSFSVPAAASNGVVSVGLGLNHFIALRFNGFPVVFGNNTYGQTNVPPTATNLVALVAGLNHCLGLLSSGRSNLQAQSTTRTVPLGQPTALVANSIGTSLPSYQWQLNGTNLPGATQASLVLPTVRWTNAGVYRVILSDVFGSVMGPTINLNILPPVLQFDSRFSSYNIVSNSFQMRLVGASGTGNLILYSSEDLLQWTPLLTNPPVQGPLLLTVPTDANSTRTFFRAAEVYGP